MKYDLAFEYVVANATGRLLQPPIVQASADTLREAMFERWTDLDGGLSVGAYFHQGTVAVQLRVEAQSEGQAIETARYFIARSIRATGGVPIGSSLRRTNKPYRAGASEWHEVKAVSASL